jgi:hypothetical protein
MSVMTKAASARGSWADEHPHFVPGKPDSEAK